MSKLSFNTPKRALITGITGQDGAYLAALLLAKGYEVHGMRRRLSADNNWRIQELVLNNKNYAHQFHLHYGDMTDTASLFRVVNIVQPHEIYNLAAQSHVATSFEMPEYTAQVDGIGIIRLLEAVRSTGLAESVRIYQASTSELFGTCTIGMQNEQTPFMPRSPYAAAKVYAYWITRNYREAYNMFISNGILFNHESPFRDASFVTRKITSTLARIHYGSPEILYLGNLNAYRDWGYAPDYVEAMWLMLQHHTPDDFVIATGQTHTVRQFVEHACAYLGITIAWEKTGWEEYGINAATGKPIIAVDQRFYRPTDVEYLHGDATKAHLTLGWQPKITFSSLVFLMMEADLERARVMVKQYNKQHHYASLHFYPVKKVYVR